MNFPPDLLKYAEKTQALDAMQVMIPNGLIPDDLFIKAGKTKFSGEELRFLGENHQILYKLYSNQLNEDEIKKSGKSNEELEEITKRFVSLIQRSFGITPMIPGNNSDMK